MALFRAMRRTAIDSQVRHAKGFARTWATAK
nr:MAG TPA: hypothetical protein [Caudoviricetes sp.]